MLILKSEPWVTEHEAELKIRVAAFRSVTHRSPGITAVIVGQDPASQTYVAAKERAAQRVGFATRVIALPDSVSPTELKRTLSALGADPKVDGILLQRPLPAHIPEREAIYWIEPAKDVDCFHPENVGRLMLGLPGLRSCTPAGVLRLLAHYGVELVGRHACVVGRSAIVGRPMGQLLLQAGCTLTQVHRQSRDLAALTRTADLLVVAAGSPGLIGAEHVAPGAIVIDVGIHRVADENGATRLIGDVQTDAVVRDGRARAISPVPGGVGPTTIQMLLANTLQAALERESAASRSP